MRRGGTLTAPPVAAPFVAAARQAHRRLAVECGDEAALGRVLAGTYVALCRERGVRPADELVPELTGDFDAVPALLALPPSGMAHPSLLGDVHEALLATPGRRARGAFYTPGPAARRIVEWALAAAVPGSATRQVTVCDPTCGGGSFLLAAADALARLGVPREQIISEHIRGADVEERAVAVTRASLALWSGTGRTPPRHAVVVADALTATRGTWVGAGDGFTAVVGNPPFLGQLARATVRTEAAAAGVRERFGAAARPYTDTAALVLLVAVELAADGGVVTLIQPESFLAARDTAAARRALAERASLQSLWLADDSLFDAGVRVCVPVLTVGRRRDGRRREVTVRHGPDATPVCEVAAPAGAAWAALAAAAAGVPDPTIAASGVLGDWCTATAGFRDEYYGLVPFVEDAGAGEDQPSGELAPLVTSGLVEPGRCDWARRPARFARRRWEAPAVRLGPGGIGGLEGGDRLARWLRRCLVPKVVVATQTPVIEAAVDEEGRWVPCTPVIALVCPPERLWHAAAVLLSPVATAWARREAHGTALSAAAVKLSARQVLAVPSPPPGADWDGAADAVRRAAATTGADAWRAALMEAGQRSCRAFGLSPADTNDLVAWWSARLPPWRC